MTSKLFDQMKNIGVDFGDTETQFEALLSIPDEQFAQIYNSKQMKKEIDKIFSSKEYQDEIMNNIKTSPISPSSDIEAEKAVVEEAIKAIQEEPKLSNEKKEFLVTIIEKTVAIVWDMIEVPRERVTIDVQKVDSDVKLPTYAHKSDAGADIYSNETIEIAAGETKIVKTGLKVSIPVGYMINIVPRSGLSAKTKLRVANCIGVIDPSYRGEIGVILDNIGTTPITINKGDRIAQMLINPTPMIKWNEVDELDSTERGEGGFGSTGN